MKLWGFFFALLRMQTCDEVLGGGETLSLRRFHRNAAAAPSLLSQKAVSFNSINADVIAGQKTASAGICPAKTRHPDLCPLWQRRGYFYQTPQ